MKRAGVASVGATALAFIASQHHNLHMLLLAVGVGGSGLTFLQAFPTIRRLMLLLSLGMVALNLRSLQRGRSTGAMRTVIIGFSALSLGLIVWSLIRFGL